MLLLTAKYFRHRVLYMKYIKKLQQLQARNLRMVKMRERGMTLAAIALEFGLTRQRVAKVIEAMMGGK
jgi:DNA-binding CsgD family transcriptional regulator